MDTSVIQEQCQKKYIITAVDIATRFAIARTYRRHNSQSAADLLRRMQIALGVPIQKVITDNGSEFMKHFDEELRRLHKIHWHTYTKTPKMNAHVERFNRTLQDEFLDFHKDILRDPDTFNRRLMDYLIWYNTRRVHHAFQNKLSPVQFLASLTPNQLPPQFQECKTGWPHTLY